MTGARRHVQQLSAEVLTAARRVARRARAAATRAVPAGTGGQGAVTAGATHPVEQAVPARSPGPAPLPVTAWVAGSERLTWLMEPEWAQHALTPSAAGPDAEDPDGLVLLELAGDLVPGWSEDELDEALGRWRRAGLPVVVWVTRRPSRLPVWRSQASAVVAVDATVADHVAGLGAAVTTAHSADRTTDGTEPDPWAQPRVLPPAAQPRLHSVAGDGPTSTRRRETVAVVLEEDQARRPPLTDVVSAALRPWPDADARVFPVAGAALPTEARLTARLEPVTGWAAAVTGAATASVGLDLGHPGSSAWTTLGLLAGGASVVGTGPAPADLPADLAALIPRTDEPAELRSELTARLRQLALGDREAHRLRRLVLAEHTARHRAGFLAGLAGVAQLPDPSSSTPVSAVVPTNRPDELDNVLANIGRQAHQDTELVLVLHGLAVDQASLRSRAADQGVEHLTVVEADATLTLGACMNLGVDAAQGAYIAKMDDDNIYGAHYLTDLLACFDYVDAGIVGKWCHYVWLRSSGAVVLRYVDHEHRYERRIQGGSMLFAREVVRDLRFSDIPRAVDSDILDRAREARVGIYSADRYNYVSVRGVDRQAHTWTVADSTFMTASGRLEFFGDPREHVSV